MAFFTRVNLSVPVLPPDDTNSELSTIQYRRHISDLANSGDFSVQSQIGASKILKENAAINTALINARTNSSMIKSNNARTLVSASNGLHEEKNAVTNLASGSSKVVDKSNKLLEETENDKSSEDTDSNSKRYEYVVDRVLGVEVWFLKKLNKKQSF